MNNKFICFLLLIIIICSTILIYKIEHSPKYNSEKFAQVYDEYNIITNIASSSSGDKSFNNYSDIKDVLSVYKNSSGNLYKTLGAISIPKIKVSYPIINDYSEENLNIAPVKLLGPAINTPGNLVIVGHNNWNKEFFSNLHKLENGDIVELTSTTGNKLIYKVYNKYKIKQDDFSCLDQNTNGKTELTLITCVKFQKNKRLIIKCVAN